MNRSLFEYITYKWFRHCKSYQDLVTQNPQLSGKSLKHKLDIPLLNSFLGSFDHASTSYVKWQALLVVDTNKPEDFGDRDNYDLCHVVHSSHPVSPIFLAAYAGLGILVDWLWLSEGVKGNIRNSYGEPLLNIAAGFGTSLMVQRILAQGFLDDHGNILHDEPVDTIRGFENTTALCIASAHGQTDIVSLLLDQGADINLLCGEDGSRAALTAAVGSKHLDIVTLLLDRGADINLVTGDGHYGNSALGGASFIGSQDLITLLLDRGADINLVGGYFGSALASAAPLAEKDIVTFLLDRGADINVVCGYYGSALAVAANYGKHDIVTLLLDRGADINLIGGKYGSPLGAATAGNELRLSQENMDVVAVLLDREADVNLLGCEYGTALATAAYYGFERIVTHLLDCGADINLSGGQHRTALATAAEKGNRNIVRLLLDRGAIPPDNWAEIWDEHQEPS